MSNRITTVSVRLDQDEKEEWQKYADQHHDGSLSRMLRSLVTNALYNSSKSNSDLDTAAIKEIVEQSQSQLKDELTTIKTLMYDILAQQRETSKLDSKEIVKSKIRQLLVSSDKDPEIREVYENITKLPEAKDFFENSSNPWNDYFILFDEVTTELEDQ